MFESLADIVGYDNVRAKVPMSEHTTFRIGGCCDYFVIPHKVDEIREILSICKKYLAGAKSFRTPVAA